MEPVDEKFDLTPVQSKWLNKILSGPKREYWMTDDEITRVNLILSKGWYDIVEQHILSEIGKYYKKWMNKK